jgi:hypothetical protein
MSDLQTLYQTIDQLNADELVRVQQYIEQRRQVLPPSPAVMARIAVLQSALAEFRSGTTQAEWDEIAAAMNKVLC